MFDITISGRIKQKKKVEQFVRDCLHHYFGNRIKRRVDIDIDMVRELDQGQVAGYCHGDKDQVNIELARHWSKDTRSNRIRHEYTLEDLVCTLAHEVVHAKQFIRGEITQRNNKWKHKNYQFDCARTNYYNQPWEIEAYKSEDMLVELYWNKVWENEEA